MELFILTIEYAMPRSYPLPGLDSIQNVFNANWDYSL